MKKVGLVLSGGGAKGAYEVGVWKALDIMGILPYIDGIYGTSVGALNAALLDTCGTWEAQNIWLNFKKSDFFNVSMDKQDTAPAEQTPKLRRWLKLYAKIEAVFITKYLLALPGAALIGGGAVANYFALHGLPFSQEGINQLIKDKIDFSRQHRTIVAFCMKSRRPHQVVPFDLQQYDANVRRKILLASSAIPYIYQGKQGIQIDGTGYFDGGAEIPLKCKGVNTPTVEMIHDGWEKVITVWLDPKAEPYESKRAAQVNIIPSSKEIGKFFTGTLKVDKDKMMKDMTMGFQDTLKKEEKLKDLIKGLSPY